MECDKNPFLEMSQDQIQQIEEVLKSEQAKVLLQETSEKLFDAEKTGGFAHQAESADLPVITSSIESLNDLENLVLEPVSQELFAVSNDDMETIDPEIFPVEVLSKRLEMNMVLMDHSYSLNPASVSRMSVPEERSLDVAHFEEVQGGPDISDEADTQQSDVSSPSPIRRSRRQIEKTEREHLGKMKAENAELERREKEALERLKLEQVSNPSISLERISLKETFQSSSMSQSVKQNENLINEVLRYKQGYYSEKSESDGKQSAIEKLIENKQLNDNLMNEVLRYKPEHCNEKRDSDGKQQSAKEKFHENDQKKNILRNPDNQSLSQQLKHYVSEGLGDTDENLFSDNEDISRDRESEKSETTETATETEEPVVTNKKNKRRQTNSSLIANSTRSRRESESENLKTNVNVCEKDKPKSRRTRKNSNLKTDKEDNAKVNVVKKRAVSGRKSSVQNEMPVENSSVKNSDAEQTNGGTLRKKNVKRPSVLKNNKAAEKNIPIEVKDENISKGNSMRRKKCTSVSEDQVSSKTLPAKEKKRCLSTDSKEVPTVQPSATKPKILKARKKSVRNESLGDLLGPALFSQPDMMVKVKTDENSDKKEDKNKLIINEMTSNQSGTAKEHDNEKNELVSENEKKPDKDFVIMKEDSVSNKDDINELDLIKAEVELEQIKMKQSPLKSASKVNVTVDENVSVAVSTEAHVSLSKFNIDNSMPCVTLERYDAKTEKHISAPAECNVETRIISKVLRQNSSNSNAVPCKVETIAVRTYSKRKKKSNDNEKFTSKSSDFSTSQGPELSDIYETVADIAKAVKGKFFSDDEFSFDNKADTNKIEQVEVSKNTKQEPESPKPKRKSPRVIQRKTYGDDWAVKEISSKRNTTSKSSQESVKKNLFEEKACEPDEQSDSDEEDDDDDDEDWSSEDDPEKLWCICRKPHNNKFMIQCDGCEDWFHGTCVGVTRQLGRQLERQKKEWKCPNCLKASQQKLASSSSSTSQKKSEVAANKSTRSAVAAREKRTSTSSSVECNSDKNESLQDVKLLKHDKGSENTNMNAVTSPASRDKTPVKDNVVFENVKNVKGKSIENKDSKVALKADISKDQVFIKNDKIKFVAKNETNKTVIDDKTVIPSREKLGLHKDKNQREPEKNSLASSNNTKPVVKQNVNDNSKSNNLVNNSCKPRKNSLPAVKEIKFREIRKKCDCIVCSKPAPNGTVYCSQTCLEKYAEETIRITVENHPSTNAEELKSLKLVALDRQTGSLISGANAPSVKDLCIWLKSNPSFEILRSTLPAKKEKKQEVKAKPPEKKEENDDAAKESVRLNVRKTLKNILEERCKNADDLKMAEDEIRKIAVQIEEELHKYLKDNSFKYRTKYRSLMFNIKDPRNQGLFRKILKSKIPPDQLVRMSTDELASSDLAKWREQENQHSLDMIKRMQIEQQQSAGHLLKKTHKGEVEIEDEDMRLLEQDMMEAPEKIDIENTAEESKEEKKEKKEKSEDQEAQKDTTHLHRSHLFDLNCKICTGKIAPPPPEEPAPKRIRVAHSISVEQNSPQVSENQVSGRRPSMLKSDDSSDYEPSSTTYSSPDTTSISRKLSTKPPLSVWKGFISMQDVGKFVTSAYKVSGPTDSLSQDIPDTIQVCGRITPDQVWDYLSKIKQSGNKELIILRFQPANDEEAVTYNTFYIYLNSRKRYGVVNGHSKMIKDFYILPLAAHCPVPMVLVPFDGPGLPSHRPHLLLGVIVRHKSKQLASAAQSTTAVKNEDDESYEGSYTPPLESRSYTPPLPASSPDQVQSSSSVPTYDPSYENNKQESPGGSTPIYIPQEKGALKRAAEEDDEPYEPSYTPPLEKMPKIENSTCIKGEEASDSYDPELNINLGQSSFTTSALTSLIKTCSENDSLSDNSPTSSLERQKEILNELTREVEETDRQMSQSLDTLKKLGAISPEVSSITDVTDSLIEGIGNINSSGMSSFLDLPRNLQEILNAVRQKSFDLSKEHEASSDSDMRCLPEIKSDTDIRCFGQDDTDIRQLPSYSPNIQGTPEITQRQDIDERSSQGGTPPLYDNDDDESSMLRPSDPRIKIRTSFQEQVYNDDAQKVSLSDMSTSELVERAQKELEAIETTETEKDQQLTPSSSSTSYVEDYQVKAWDQYNEPPPPGIDLNDMPPPPPPESISFVNKSEVLCPTNSHTTPAQSTYPPLPAVLPENQTINAPFTATAPPPLHPPLPASFQPHLPPPFSVQAAPQPQPPNMDIVKNFPPPTLPPPPPAVLPPRFISPERRESHLPPKSNYQSWPDTSSADVDWRDQPSRWEERDWDMRHRFERERQPSDRYRERETEYHPRERRRSVDWHSSDYPSSRERPPWPERDWDHDERFDGPPPERINSGFHRFRRGNNRNNWRGRRKDFRKFH